ncbi:Receptor-type adenylate cyclase [Seminavis robusta]|uniref:Receptor-type adenylate cyclase n=1 Tax=Seminavis robusta TaxID=568900 RepID=A0A9N8EZ32_9STRA|nr:Receptor-type adenylate cyclase [Seminavis robusta]|eukprot:Sro2601_g332360.1 Receptor-type adenylate cyclase (317) ;mRNA; r:9876-10826
MGAQNSILLPLQELSSVDVAEYVKDLRSTGPMQMPSKQVASMEHSWLTSLTKETFEETLDSLEVNNRLHRRKLERVLSKTLSDQKDQYSKFGCLTDTECSLFSFDLDDSSSTRLSSRTTSRMSDTQIRLQADNRTTSNTSIVSSDSSQRRSTHSERGHRKTTPDIPTDMAMQSTSSTSAASSQRGSTHSRRGHRKTTLDVSIEMVMQCALVAKEIDDLDSTSPPMLVPAVLTAALAVQAEENHNLQQEILELETEREIHSPPEGMVAIVLTDIEGSTSLWESNPQAMKEAPSMHDTIQRETREKHLGYEIDTGMRC